MLTYRISESDPTIRTLRSLNGLPQKVLDTGRGCSGTHSSRTTLGGHLPGWVALSSDTLYSLLMAAITKHHTLGGLKPENSSPTVL